jgi:hypothetical protein
MATKLSGYSRPECGDAKTKGTDCWTGRWIWNGASNRAVKPESTASPSLLGVLAAGGAMTIRFNLNHVQWTINEARGSSVTAAH